MLLTIQLSKGPVILHKSPFKRVLLFSQMFRLFLSFASWKMGVASTRSFAHAEHITCKQWSTSDPFFGNVSNKCDIMSDGERVFLNCLLLCKSCVFGNLQCNTLRNKTHEILHYLLFERIGRFSTRSFQSDFAFNMSINKPFGVKPS